MKRFGELVVINFRKITMPVIITSVITLFVQVFMYVVVLFTENRGNEDYPFNERISLWLEGYYMPNELCHNPIPFYEKVSIWFWIGIVSMTAVIMLVQFKGEEIEKNVSILSMLPVSRGMLWGTKFIQVLLSLICVFCMNYTAMCINYLVYISSVKEGFREIFLFSESNSLMKIFIIELAVVVILSLFISVKHTVKYYLIKTAGKAGNENE